MRLFFFCETRAGTAKELKFLRVYDIINLGFTVLAFDPTVFPPEGERHEKILYVAEYRLLHFSQHFVQ